MNGDNWPAIAAHILGHTDIDQIHDATHGTQPRTRGQHVTLYRCDECDQDHTSIAALERCDCGAEDRYYSPSRNRLSYYPGDD